MTIAQDLKVKAGQAKEPGLVPNGRWELRCNGGKLEANENFDPEDTNSSRYTGYLMFVPVKPIANFEKADVAGGEWRGAVIFKRFYVRQESDLVDADKILTALGFELDGSREYEDLFPLAKNKTLTADVGVRNRKDRFTGANSPMNTLSDYASA